MDLLLVIFLFYYLHMKKIKMRKEKKNYANEFFIYLLLFIEMWENTFSSCDHCCSFFLFVYFIRVWIFFFYALLRINGETKMTPSPRTNSIEIDRFVGYALLNKSKKNYYIYKLIYNESHYRMCVATLKKFQKHACF